MPRGFTVLELMVVVALLAILTGLVAPSLITRLGESRERSVQEQLRAAIDEARAESARSGVSMAAIAAHSPDGLNIKALPWGSASSLLESNDADPRDWDQAATLALVTGVGAPGTEPTWQADAFADEDPGLDVHDGDEPAFHLIGVFFPDGSAFCAADTWLPLAPDRAVRIRIHPWTGRADVTIEVEPAEEDAGEEDELDSADATLEESSLPRDRRSTVTDRPAPEDSPP